MKLFWLVCRESSDAALIKNLDFHDDLEANIIFYSSFSGIYMSITCFRKSGF